MGSNPITRSIIRPRSSVAERFLGKEEVSGSIPLGGSSVRKNMLDKRPWFGDFYPLLSVLQENEPELQLNLGQQRKCEHDLVIQVVRDSCASTYVEIGSGNGILLMSMKEALPDIRIIGFEIEPCEKVLSECRSKGIDFRSQDIFSDDEGDSFREQMKGFIEESDGPLVAYTDNGSKPAELEIVSDHMRPGDICGTHDYSGPDWAGFIRFLKGRSFATLKDYESFIIEHMCLQRFWVKKDHEVLENPCDRFI